MRKVILNRRDACLEEASKQNFGQVNEAQLKSFVQEGVLHVNFTKIEGFDYQASVRNGDVLTITFDVRLLRRQLLYKRSGNEDTCLITFGAAYAQINTILPGMLMYFVESTTMESSNRFIFDLTTATRDDQPRCELSCKDGVHQGNVAKTFTLAANHIKWFMPAYNAAQSRPGANFCVYCMKAAAQVSQSVLHPGCPYVMCARCALIEPAIRAKLLIPVAPASHFCLPCEQLWLVGADFKDFHELNNLRH